jgi:hypothetical protein
MRDALALQRGSDFLVELPLLGALFGEAEAEAGDLRAALATVDEQIALIARTGQRWYEPEANRIRGETLLKLDPANPAPAEEALQTAIVVSKKQATRSFELRAALSLAKLCQSTGRAVEAHAVLAPALEGFSPTPAMPEIAEAQQLLSALSKSDEVKAEAARRQRLTQLHVARGVALFAARGGGAPETTAAFASAREQTFGGEATSERFVADFGLWAAATSEASFRRCGRTQRPSSTMSRRSPSRPKPVSPIAPPGSPAGSPGSIARLGITWSARWPCSNPAATTN